MDQVSDETKKTTGKTAKKAGSKDKKNTKKSPLKKQEGLSADSKASKPAQEKVQVKAHVDGRPIEAQIQSGAQARGAVSDNWALQADRMAVNPAADRVSALNSRALRAQGKHRVTDGGSATIKNRHYTSFIYQSGGTRRYAGKHW